MTTARLTSSPPEGSGLTNRFNDQQYQALIKGQPTGQVVMIVVAEAVGYGQRKTAKGVHQHVIWDYVIVEPILDVHDADQARHLAQSQWDKRHTSQRLPLDWPSRGDEDQRQFLFGLIDEWAAEENRTPGEIGEAWREHFGIDPQAKDTPAGFAPVDYRKADAHKLREFCLSVGVLADDTEADPGEDEPEEAAS